LDILILRRNTIHTIVLNYVVLVHKDMRFILLFVACS
jgi:hypothetical protein